MILGLTGGIGAGKSYIAERLRRKFDIPVYDCDSEAKRLNVESEVIRQNLTQLVGAKVYDAQGNLERQVLADFLFASNENAEKINAIIHPVVASDFKDWAQSNKERPFIAMESAILFESGFCRLTDKVVCVTAPEELRIERATRRDKSSAESVKRRIMLQMSDEERCHLSDFVIMNDGRDVDSQIALILNKLKDIN